MSQMLTQLSNKAIPVCIVSILVTGCTTQLTEEEFREKYQAIQITRLVADAEYVPSRQFVRRMFYRSKVAYNETYREPNQPIPLRVNCAETEKIGVIYALVTHKHPSGRQIKVRYVWAHDSFESNDPKLNHIHTVYIPKRGYQWITSETLELKTEFRVDGVFKLTASIDGHTLLENAFELVGCSH